MLKRIMKQVLSIALVFVCLFPVVGCDKEKKSHEFIQVKANIDTVTNMEDIDGNKYVAVSFEFNADIKSSNILISSNNFRAETVLERFKCLGFGVFYREGEVVNLVKQDTIEFSSDIPVYYEEDEEYDEFSGYQYRFKEFLLLFEEGSFDDNDKVEYYYGSTKMDYSSNFWVI